MKHINSPLTGFLAAACFAVMTLFTACPMDDFKNITIEGINLSSAKDGTYEGVYETTLVKATVLVTVKSAQITDIEITRHECGKGKPAETIVKNVVDKQSTQVDTVSGATGSSLVILKAIEDAVAKASI
jgi:uncharacterized protein with FMN-binding domain